MGKGEAAMDLVRLGPGDLAAQVKDSMTNWTNIKVSLGPAISDGLDRSDP